jgi:outer membrane protein OmpA-like peptidoglycan-associated protein
MGLSQNRAEAVRDYLQKVWNVAGERISVESRALPEKPSNVNEPDGIEENRRVEIYSDNPKILEPVLTSDTLRSATPPGIRFRTSAQAEAGLASWRLTAGQSGQVLKEFSGVGPIPPMLDWHLEEDQARVPKTPIPVDYQLEVTDDDGQTYAVPMASIPTDQVTIQRKRRERIADKEINRYSLILFDFGKADLNAANRKIIDMIKNRITLDATVSISGYTDRLGDEDFNQKLSEERARTVLNALGVGKPLGAGETMLYNNDLPEGRFYCRTVKVVVETPIVE